MAKPKVAKQKVTFSYSAPEARTVSLVGDFTGWQQAPISMKKDKAGRWTKTVSLPPGKYEYRLLVDGEWRNDPQCPNRTHNQYGDENCVCIIESPVPVG